MKRRKHGAYARVDLGSQEATKTNKATVQKTYPNKTHGFRIRVPYYPWARAKSKAIFSATYYDMYSFGERGSGLDSEEIAYAKVESDSVIFLVETF